MKRMVSVMIVVLIIIFWTLPAYALTIPTPGDTLSINDDSVQITQAGTYTITGTSATTNTIVVSPNIDGDVNITLNGVNINVSAITNACAFIIGTGTTVNLTMRGTNILKSGMARAGLNVPVGAVLNIDGTGSLEAAGRGDMNNGGAGIGGNAGGSAGPISINSGTVTATGGTLGAGIGGGNRGTGGNITISAGTVTATSGYDAAGIGGGDSGSAGQITITGGSVTALSIRDGAGIGGGWNGNGGIVTISGGIVSATSNEDGAGIGSGNGSTHTCTGGTVIIEGSADVTARGGVRGAGIGGGNNSNGGNITISGGTVTATGGHNGAGIGSGYGLNGGNITISGGTVTATGGEDGAGIGGGIGGEGGNIKICGGIVIANGGSQGTGIGGGLLRIGGSIDISGGEIYATGGPARSVSSVNKPGHDIGDGGGASSTEHTRFRLSGNTAVFMRNGASVAATHRDFKDENMSVNNLKANYGYNHFPASWGNEYVYGYIYDTVYYYVEFVPQNGATIAAQAVDKGNKATKPNELLRDGFVFGGWFSDISYNDVYRWDFDTNTVEKPTTLYAKWITAYTVTFDSQGGSAVSSQTIAEGHTAMKPSDPTMDDYRFDGWYISSDCKDDELWDFDTDTVGADTILYAKWIAAPTYTVIFDTDSGSAVGSQTVDDGDKVVKPSDPTWSGYSFDGWYTSSSCNDDDRWNFKVCPVTSDITLYAKWTEKTKSSDISPINLDKSAKSRNTTLTDITVDGVSINGFSPVILSYHINVPNSRNSAQIEALAIDSKATISGDIGGFGLRVGDNSFSINVTAENGDMKTYSITISRASNDDATLQSFMVNGEMVVGFIPSVTDYEMQVDKDTDKVTLCYTPTSSKVKTSFDYPLSPGENVCRVKVTTNDFEQEYTLTINREKVAFSPEIKESIDSNDTTQDKPDLEKTNSKQGLSVFKTIMLIVCGIVLMACILYIVYWFKIIRRPSEK